MAPPLLSKRDKTTGHLRKRKFPQATLTAFKLLAKLKGLRGTRWDIFGYSAERKQERQLITEYEQSIENLLSDLKADNYQFAVEIAALPKLIRGFGHVKQANIETVKRKRDVLLDQFYGRSDKIVRMVEMAA